MILLFIFLFAIRGWRGGFQMYGRWTVLQGTFAIFLLLSPFTEGTNEAQKQSLTLDPPAIQAQGPGTMGQPQPFIPPGVLIRAPTVRLPLHTRDGNGNGWGPRKLRETRGVRQPEAVGSPTDWRTEANCVGGGATLLQPLHTEKPAHCRWIVQF